MLPSTIFSLPILALAAGAAAKGVSTTPHDKYSSSVGVLGCKIDTNRVAYWPGSVDCDKICVKLSYGGRSVNLLRIDQSGGAYDISYDAWVYLQSGKSAKSNPLNGGGVDMEYEEVDASECASLIKTGDGKLPLSASNSMNFLTSCLAQPNSYVAKNYALYNICDAICSMGFDESCKLDLATSNQPSCKNTLGLTTKLSTAPVYDIQFGTGKSVLAGTGDSGPVVDIPDTTTSSAAPVAPAPSSSSSSSKRAESTSAPAPAPTTAEQKPTTTAGGIFHEVPSSASSAAAVDTTVAAPASSQSSAQTSVAVASSSVAASSSSAPAPSSSSLPTLTSTPVPVSSSVVVSSSHALTNSSVPSTTLASVTVSSTQAGTTPSASTTSVPANAGHRGIEVSVLALVSSVVVCSLVGLF